MVFISANSGYGASDVDCKGKLHGKKETFKGCRLKKWRQIYQSNS